MMFSFESEKKKGVSGRNKSLNERSRMILSILESGKNHPSADEIYELIKKKLPGTGIATVYRNLELLHSLGLVRKIEFGDKCRYDSDLREHYHAVCVRCGKIADIFMGLYNSIIKKISRLSGFEIHSLDIEINGVCPDCRKKGKKCREL